MASRREVPQPEHVAAAVQRHCDQGAVHVDDGECADLIEFSGQLVKCRSRLGVPHMDDLVGPSAEDDGVSVDLAQGHGFGGPVPAIDCKDLTPGSSGKLE